MCTWHNRMEKILDQSVNSTCPQSNLKYEFRHLWGPTSKTNRDKINKNNMSFNIKALEAFRFHESWLPFRLLSSLMAPRLLKQWYWNWVVLPNSVLFILLIEISIKVKSTTYETKLKPTTPVKR